jgi:hypothetical protein
MRNGVIPRALGVFEMGLSGEIGFLQERLALIDDSISAGSFCSF